MVSVTICEERRAVREDLSRVITAVSQLARVEHVSGGDQLVASYTRCPTDVVLLGVSLGAPMVTQLLSVHPSAAVVAFGSLEELRPLLATLNAAGVDGFLRWEPGDRYRAAPRARVTASATLPCGALDTQPDTVNSFVSGNRAASVPLSEREYEMLLGMVQGKSNRDIARELFISFYTAKGHAHRLFVKLGVTDRASAVAQGFRMGIVS